MDLAASEEAISSMLAVEREGKQVPVHFVSRALQGPEVNYLALEKTGPRPHICYHMATKVF